MTNKLLLAAAITAVLAVLVIAPTASATPSWLTNLSFDLTTKGANLIIEVDAADNIPSNAVGENAGFGWTYTDTSENDAIVAVTDSLDGMGSGWNAYNVEFTDPTDGAPDGCITEIISPIINGGFKFQSGNMELKLNHNEVVSNNLSPNISSFTLEEDTVNCSGTLQLKVTVVEQTQ